jgi:hypothetical protein
MKLAIASLLVGSAAAFAPAQQAFRATTSLQATATDAKVCRMSAARDAFRWREESQLLPRMFREGMEIRLSMNLACSEIKNGTGYQKHNASNHDDQVAG